ncbi:unnamed protein product [Euphydryas editha]|uniref:CCHC-type domain-containing protein n=1 Tax=Euphydryas editha TaxID=104508 RepID=A0AAU9V513_EUPED|nr:unnamed protein product [Euphydryas editha]
MGLMIDCEELNLKRAMRICQAEEIAQEGEQQMCSTSGNATYFDSVKIRGRNQEASRGWRSRLWNNKLPRTSTSWRNADDFPGLSSMTLCSSCGYSRCNKKVECPARQVKCFTCGNQGHFSRRYV